MSYVIADKKAVFLKGSSMFRFQLFILFSTLIFVFSFFSVSAQTTGDLRLVTSPLPISLTTEPGKSISTPIRVKNDGGGEEKLQVSLMKFGAYGERGTPQLMDPESDDDFLSWVSFSENEFTVAPGEWKTVTATFNVPETAAFGYYYAIVFSRAGEQINVQPGQTALTGGTAVLVLLEAKVPNAVRQVEIAEFSADRKWYEFLPATFTIRLKNTGNVHISPRGNIFIGRPDQKGSSLLEVNLEKGNILPNSYREFQVKWDDAFPVYREKQEDGRTVLDEKGNIVSELVWDWKDAAKFRWGTYEASLLLIYDDGQRDVPIEGTLTFSVWPWRIFGVAAVITLFALLGLKNTLMNIWKRFFSRKVSI